MSIFSRIFGTPEAAMPLPQDFVEYTNDKGTERLRMVADGSMTAQAARWNANMIYGRQNVPQNFGMVPMIEVKDKDGKWKPVTGGSGKIGYDMETQLGALASFRETGIIGPQGVAGEGSMTQSGGGKAAGADSTAAGPSGAFDIESIKAAIDNGEAAQNTKPLAEVEVIESKSLKTPAVTVPQVMGPLANPQQVIGPLTGSNMLSSTAPNQRAKQIIEPGTVVRAGQASVKGNWSATQF